MKIIQKPNPPLLVAIAAFLIKIIFAKGLVHHLGDVLLTVSLIVWSYLEVMKGVNWFRKLLGAIVLISIFVSLFKRLSG